MKKLIIALIATVMVAGIGQAQVAPATFSGLAAVSGYTSDNFSTFGGSFSVGTQVVTDAERSLFTRILYHRINVGATALESFDLSAIQYWYIGQKWSFFANPGVSVGLSDNGNPIFLGLGLERKLFQAKDQNHLMPLALSVWADCQITEKTSQVTIGLRFTKPQ